MNTTRELVVHFRQLENAPFNHKIINEILKQFRAETMVNVTKSNFLEKSQDLIDRLPSAAFAAIDLGE